MQNRSGRNAIDDIDLAAAIAALLHCRAGLGLIMVAVTDGVVTLDGAVTCEADGKAAESAVRRLAGVRGVENCITIQAAASEGSEPRGDRPASE
jgi:osmotically-inducible protein OsmY